MIIDVRAQIANAHIPLKCAYLFAGFSEPFSIVGIPPKMATRDVVAVTLSLTNADGATFPLPCVRGERGVWNTAAAESCFPSHGLVKRGMRISVTVKSADGSTSAVMIAFGDIDIAAVSADVPPGDPTKAFVAKGDDVYLKSQVVEGTQHYVKMTMEYDPEIGWGANWSGDYILVDGNFVEVDNG